MCACHVAKFIQPPRSTNSPPLNMSQYPVAYVVQRPHAAPRNRKYLCIIAVVLSLVVIVSYSAAFMWVKAPEEGPVDFQTREDFLSSLSDLERLESTLNYSRTRMVAIHLGGYEEQKYPEPFNQDGNQIDVIGSDLSEYDEYSRSESEASDSNSEEEYLVAHAGTSNP
jgi:hypothetical protein